jgi:hypothetical protein
LKLFSTILNQAVSALDGRAKTCRASAPRRCWGLLASSILVIVLAGTVELRSQSLANYTITRQTGITYNSISSTGNSIPAWRNSYQWIYDDNRSYPIPIGFDFWYDGIRYTTLSVSTNGFVDFSSSAADGSIGANQTGRDYDSENFTVSSTVPYPGSRASWNVLAPMYYDLTTQNETNPLGSSFKYLTTGVAPNRVFIVEYDSLSAWNQAGLGTALNFQVRLYETTGKIEFAYGNMIPGTASYAYTCAINGPDLSGGLTAANFQTLQTVNTATFGTTPQNSLTPPPASLSQLRFLPPTPLDPTALTFTGVTTTAMTLNWTDNATNEVGYAVYQSSDGSNYSFLTQLAAHAGTGAMSYASTGLIPNTTYYWRIYAVTEGGVSNVLAGSQTTSGSPNDTSATSGLWSNPSTWRSGSVPTTITNVVIKDGHTVTIDRNFTVNSLTLGTGASGILRFGNDNTPRYDTVATNVIINSGAVLDVSTSSNTNGHLLVVGGDLTNNGTLNFAADADSKVRLEFNKSGTQVINGSGSVTKVYRITLNMGVSSNNILDIFTPSFTADTANFVVINNGTLRFSTSATMTPLAGNAQIPANGGLWLNSSSANITVTDSLVVAGLLRVTNGTLSVGSTVNGNLRSAGGTFVFEGGTTTVAGLFDAKDITTITNFSMNAGTLTVNTSGSTYAYSAPFSMPIAGSSFTMTGGTIIIQRMSGNNLGYTNTGASSSYAVSGGTIQIGNGSTPGTDVLKIQSNIPIYNLTISGLAGATGLAGTNLMVLNNVTVGSSTVFNGSTQTTTVGGNWNNSGTYTSGTSTVVFNGTSQSISRAAGESFNNMTVNSTGTVSLSNNVVVVGAFALNQGTLSVGTNTLRLDGAVSASSGTLTSASTGTVNYNQGSVGQAVLAANYGNLTFSNFNKTLASSGTIGIAGTFTQGSAVGHTVTGSTINYNGGAAQNVVPFTYSNLSISNSGTKTATGVSTIQGNLSILSGPIFNDGGYAVVVNGNVANAGIHASTNPGLLSLTGGSGAHVLSGGGAYGNVTLNDANGATLSGSVTINGALTLTNGIVGASADTVMVSSTGSVARTNGYVSGFLRKYVSTGSPLMTYETGTATTYLPVTVQFASVTTPGTLTAKNTAGDHPQLASSTIEPTNSVNRYWTLLRDQIAFTTADITFNWINPSDQDNAGAYASYQVAHYANSSWQQDVSSNQNPSNIKATGISGFGDFAVGAGSASNAFRTKADGDWSNYNVVWEFYNGSSWGAASRSPGSADGTITVRHNVTITTDLSGAPTNGIDQLVINAGAMIDVQSGGTLQIVSATAPGITVNGTLKTTGTFTTSGSPTITFAGGSRYIHNQNGGAIPNGAGVSYSATSTVEITGVIGTVPTGLNQSFGYFVWNSSSQSGNVALLGNPSSVSADFVVAATGSGQLFLNDGTAATKNIGGRFSVRGGSVVAQTAGATSYSISVGDSLTVSGGGKLTLLSGAGAGTVSVTVAGNVLVADPLSQGTTLDLSASTNNSSGTINASKDFNYPGGLITQSGAGTAAGNIIFNGTSLQNLVATPSFTNRVNFTVNTGATVYLGNSVANGTGTFTVQASSVLGIGSAQGITSSGATGNVQTTGRSFSTTSNYIYNGSSLQATGNGLPATVNKLIISNAAGAQLSANVAVTDSLKLLSGLLDIQTNTLTLNNLLYRTSGSFSSATTGTVNYNKGSNGQVVIGAQYGNLTFSNFSKVLPSNPADVVKVAGTFTKGSASGHALTGSTVDFDGASQTVPVLPYNNLKISGSGTDVLAGDVTVAGTLDLSGATLSDGSFILSAYGNVNNSSAHTGTGRILLTGSSSTRSLTGGGSYTNLEINDLNNANFTGNITINGTLILTKGLLTSASDMIIVNTPTASVSKSVNFSHVNARMQKTVSTNVSPQAFTYEIGDASTYAPVNLTILSVGTAGAITVNTTGSDHPQIATSGLNPIKDVNRYWTLVNSGVVLSSYNATFNYATSDIDAGANSSVFLVRNYNAGWASATPGSRTSTSTQATGLTTFGDFAVGELMAFYWTRGAGTSSWNTAANWSTNSVPTSTSRVILNVSDTISIDPPGGNAQTLIVQNPGMRLALLTGNTLSIVDTLFLYQGTLNIQTPTFVPGGTMQFVGGTVAYANGSQTIAPYLYKELTLSGGGTKTAGAGFTVGDTLRIVSGTTFNDGGFTITAQSHIVNSGTLTGSGKISLTGGFLNHNISGGSPFNNLELNEALGATLGANTTVNGTLTLTNGVMTTGANTLTLGPSASVVRTNGYVNGNFAKPVPAGASTPTFEVGDAISYAPVSLSFSGVTTGGTLTVSTTTGDHPNIGTALIDPAATANRYWTLTNSGIVLGSYSATFNFVAGDLDAGADPTQFNIGRYVSGWTYPIVGTRTATSTQATGLAAFGDFQLGQAGGTWTSIASTNWSLGTTWDRGSAPPANSNVVITNGKTVTVDANTANIKTLNVQLGGILQGAASATTLSLGQNSGVDLINAGTINANNNLTIKLNNNSQWSGAGSFTLYKIDLNGKTLTLATGIANVDLSASGDPFLNPGILAPGTNSIINYNGAAAQDISSNAGIAFNNLLVTNTAGATLQKNLTVANLTGNLTVNALLNTANGATAFSVTGTAGKTLTVGAAGTLNVGGAGITAGAFPTGFTTYTLTAGSTVQYSNASSATQTLSAAPTYSNLAISGAGAKTLGGGTITVSGNWTNSSAGAVDATGSTVNFTGNSAAINGTSVTQTFNNLTVNKTAGQTLSIGGSTTTLNVNGAFTQTLGNFTGPATMVVTGATTLTAGTFTAGASLSTSNNWTNNGGTFTPGAGTVTFAGNSSAINGTAVTQTFNNITVNKTGGQALTIGGSTTSLSLNGAFTQTSGNFTPPATMTVGGSVTLTSGTFTAGNNMGVGGSWTNNGATFTQGAGTVTLNGSSAQTIGGSTSSTFNNLTISNTSGGVAATINAAVNGTLTLTSGIVATGGNTLTIGPAGSVTLGSGWVNGNLAKTISAATPSQTFEIGDATRYAPVVLSFTGVTSSGTLTVSSTTGDHPNIGASTIYPALTANRYWTLANSGTVFSTYDATFTFVNPGDLDAGADPTQFIVGRYVPSTWIYPTVGTKTATSTQATGLNAFGDFQLGQQAIFTSIASTSWSAPSTWTPSGPPIANSTVIIATGTVVTIDANTANIRSLTIQNGATLTGGGALTLSVGANGGTDFSNSGTFNANNVTVKLNQNSQWAGSGAFNVNNIDFNSNTLTLVAGVNVNVSGAGDPLLNPGSLVPGTNSTVTYNGSLAQTISSSANINYNNLQVTNSAGVTLQKNLTASSITGNLTVNSGGVLNTGNGTNVYTITGAGGSTALTVAASSKLNIGSSATAAGTFPTGFTTTSLNASSTVEYSNSSSATQTVAAAPTYGNILFSAGGAKSLGGGTINVVGNWTNNSGGTVDASTSTVTLGGPSAQTINGSTTTSFNNLTLSNAAGISLGIATTINGNLAINNGTLDDKGFQITGNVTGTMTMAASTGLILGNSTGTSFPTNFTNANTTLNVNSTVTYASGVAQTVSGTPIYGNLVFSGGGTKSVNSTTTANGNCAINSPAVVNIGAITLTIKGNVSNGGAIVNNGTIVVGP